ncbi:helix-turn-helix domain-containing protein [Phascolarctobacterium faecium]|jgi:transcriptional regulator with XRE-family HTH domain|uniref:helix-turn-helix domain-containing protein n=1 Tax=Phascolarctobacterium faecium TaxID=33025 RepID=UPI002057E838|nr:helix-turn-helix transcriptional regulator [Phascolarctobacterium faecium]DAW04414.1 MAG TPA: Repressor protein CI [Caudoviricetes sp.]
MTQEDIVKTQEIFAKKLRGLLDENKINQSELAEMLQVSESTVGKWLLKKALPRMGIIEKLSSIFNCPKSYLLEENETRRSYYLNPEAAKMAQEIYDNPQYKVLFDATKKLKPESIKEVMKFIDYQKAKEEGDLNE